MPVSAPSLRSERPNLRLVHDEGRSILIVGGNPERRSALVAELSQRLPAGTCFEEADATWEMLEMAPSSRMVMLAGELDGSSPESAMHLLGSRHPRLPVIALGEPVASHA